MGQEVRAFLHLISSGRASFANQSVAASAPLPPRTISTMPHRSTPSQESVSSAGSSTLDISVRTAPYPFLTLFGTSHAAPASHPEGSLTAPLSAPLHLAARSSIVAILKSAVVVGYMCIEDRDATFHFGNEKTDGNVVHLRVLSGKFWTRIFSLVSLSTVLCSLDDWLNHRTSCPQFGRSWMCVL